MPSGSSVVSNMYLIRHRLFLKGMWKHLFHNQIYYLFVWAETVTSKTWILSGINGGIWIKEKYISMTKIN